MVTFHELLDLLRSVGVDLSDLAPLLAKKAGATGAARLAGASKAVISNLIRRVRFWRAHNELEAALENEVTSSGREKITQDFLERWIISQQHEAAETAKLLFRIIYLKALRAHCEDLPVVANLGFSPQTLDAMMACDLPVSAKAILDRIPRGGVSDDSLERYDELVANLRDPQYSLVRH